MEEATLEYCPKHYKNEHQWESIGVTFTMTGITFQIWKCEKCGNCKEERLNIIT